MSKHTPEPWGVYQDASGDVFVSSGETSFHIAEIGTEDEESVIADARRIVACVNACRGMKTKDLENQAMLGETLLDRFELMKSETEQVKRKLDELLAASERLVSHHLDTAEVHPCDDGSDDIRAGQCITEARDLYLIIKQLKGCAA